mgnify:CR=1 FL=1
MDEEKIAALVEADRRGILPADKKASFDEAVRRGLISSRFMTTPSSQAIQRQQDRAAELPNVLQKPSGQMARAGKTREVDSLDFAQNQSFLTPGQRAQLSIKQTNQGKINFLKNVDGVMEVLQDPKTGKFATITEGGTHRVDETGFGLGDIGDLAGGTIEFAPTAFGITSMNPLVGMAGAGVGNLLRQGASSFVPGEEGLTEGDRAKSLLTDVAVGGAGVLVPNALVKGFDAARPGNILRNTLNKTDESSAVQQETRYLEGLSPELRLLEGQRTGDQALLDMEHRLIQDPAVSGRMNSIYQDQVNVGVRFLTDTLKQLSGKKQSVEGLGILIKKGTQGLYKTLREGRAAQATTDFDRVALLTGDRGVIPTPKTVAVIDDEIARAKGLNSDAGDADAEVLQNFRDRLVDSNGLMTPTEMQGRLSDYGAASKGKKNIIKELEDAENKRIGQRVYRALNEDLDDTVTVEFRSQWFSEEPRPEFATALKKARENYRINSDKITAVNESVMGKVLADKGATPESAIRSLLGSAPSELRASLEILDQVNPALRADLKRLYLEDMWLNSPVSGTARVPTGGRFSEGAENALQVENQSIAKFLTQMDNPGSRGTMGVLFDRKELESIQDVVELFTRIKLRGSGSSPTAKHGITGRFLDMLNSRVIRSIRNMTGSSGRSQNEMIDLLMDGDGRDAVMALTKTSKMVPKTAAAMTYLYNNYMTPPQELDHTGSVLNPPNPLASGGQMNQSRRNIDTFLRQQGLGEGSPNSLGGQMQRGRQ